LQGEQLIKIIREKVRIRKGGRIKRVRRRGGRGGV